EKRWSSASDSGSELPETVPLGLLLPYIAVVVLMVLMILVPLVMFSPIIVPVLLGQMLLRRCALQVNCFAGACRLRALRLRSATHRGLLLLSAAATAIWEAITWPVEHPGEVPRLAWLSRERGHAMEGKPIWLWSAGAVLVLLLAVRLFGAPLIGRDRLEAASNVQQPPADAVVISMVSGGNKEEWIH